VSARTASKDAAPPNGSAKTDGIWNPIQPDSTSGSGLGPKQFLDSEEDVSPASGVLGLKDFYNALINMSLPCKVP
jgi:hypothetical protein